MLPGQSLLLPYCSLDGAAEGGESIPGNYCVVVIHSILYGV